MSAAATKKKERGCFQCSRRRIVCDRTEPSCLRCAKNGIECSGLGRIRFAEGVARRGRLKDCKIPRAGGDDWCQQLPTTTGFQAVLLWPGEERAKKRKRHVNESTDAKQLTTPTPDAPEEPGHDGSPRTPPLEPARTDEEDNAGVEDICRSCDSVVTAYSHHYNVVPWIAPIAPTLRMLFSYFSDVIAPVMVVLDDDTNGYRSLVLPMAIEDEVLRWAVSVVATQHLSRQRPELQKAAEAGRAAVISRLRSDSLQQSADKVFKQVHVGDSDCTPDWRDSKGECGLWLPYSDAAQLVREQSWPRRQSCFIEISTSADSHVRAARRTTARRGGGRAHDNECFGVSDGLAIISASPREQRRSAPCGSGTAVFRFRMRNIHAMRSQCRREFKRP